MPPTNRTFRSASFERQKSGHIAEWPMAPLAIAVGGLRTYCTVGSHTSSKDRRAEAGKVADFEASGFGSFPDGWAGQASGEVAPGVRKVARGTMGSHMTSLPVDGDTWSLSRASDRIKKKSRVKCLGLLVGIYHRAVGQETPKYSQYYGVRARG